MLRSSSRSGLSAGAGRRFQSRRSKSRVTGEGACMRLPRPWQQCLRRRRRASAFGEPHARARGLAFAKPPNARRSRRPAPSRHPPVHERSRERQRSIRWVASSPPRRALVRAETGMAAGSGKSRHSSIPRAPRMPRLPTNTHDHAIVYSGSRHTALSQPAFEQCPLLGCAPTGPLRPSIGAHIKRPSHLHLWSGIPPRTRLRPSEDRVADSELTKGISRWQALEREQFRALLDSPPTQGRSEGGSKPC